MENIKDVFGMNKNKEEITFIENVKNIEGKVDTNFNFEGKIKFGHSDSYFEDM